MSLKSTGRGLCLALLFSAAACSTSDQGLQATLEAQQIEVARLQTEVAQSAEQPTNPPPPPPPSKTPVPPTPTSTRTPRPSATSRPTSTEIPVTTAEVTVASANLRAGPATNYEAIDIVNQGEIVTVLERNSASDWFRVRLESIQVEGWLSVSVLLFDFEASEIRVAQDIPPTPLVEARADATATATQPDLPEASDTPELALDAEVAIINRLAVPLSIWMSGPYTLSYYLAPGQTLTVNIPGGTYYYQATAAGFEPLIGSKTWTSGTWEWEFYVGP